MVTPNARHCDYSRHLAIGLGRLDVQFASLDTITRNGWERTRGLWGTDAVMLDHACWHFMSKAEREEFYHLQAAYGW